jgi:large subunit ribosomal protein L9
MGKKVKIIMNQDVLNIGEEGDIRDVAPGFARNYLLPRKLAVLYNEHTLTILNQKRRKIEKRKEEKKVLARGMKEQIQKEEIVFTLPAGENGKLFGSITNGHIAEELQKKGYAIERKKIEVPDHHLKTVGEFFIKVKLYGDEEADLKVVVKAQEVKAEGKPAKPEKASRSERAKSRSKAEPKSEAPSAETSAAGSPAAEDQAASAGETPPEPAGRDDADNG